LARSAFGTFGKRSANDFRCVAIAAFLQLLLQVGIARAGRNHCFPRKVVNELTIDVFVTAKNTQPWPVGAAAKLFSHAVFTPPALDV
jgi:hypothetical protein